MFELLPPPPRCVPARLWPIPWMDHSAGWKGSSFTWEMGRLILARIAEGETVKAITADRRMPAYCTVFQWMKMEPEFGAAVRDLRARKAQAKLAAREAARRARGPKRRSGRRSTYTENKARLLLKQIYAGRSLSEITALRGAPSFKAIYAWLRDRPAFRDAFVEACDYRNGWLRFQAELMIEAAPDRESLAAARAAIRALEGRAGRMTPKLYRKRGGMG